MDRVVSNKPIALLIGIGNEYRHDDAVGLVVARLLKALALPNVTVIEASGEGAALMEAWQGADLVILIDAVQSGAPPGTTHRFEAHAQPIPSEFFHTSTHAFSIAEAIEMARALGQLPPRVILYGIEGKNFEAGAGLSPEIEKAISEVAERIAQEVHETTSHRG